MGQLLDKVVEDGIKKKYIDAAEGERVKKLYKMYLLNLNFLKNG